MASHDYSFKTELVVVCFFIINSIKLSVVKFPSPIPKMSSRCGGNCGCGPSCSCASDCNGCGMPPDLSHKEGSTTETLVTEVAPQKSFGTYGEPELDGDTKPTIKVTKRQ
ncbi:metallothionein-like protein [Pyrus ussuriensis x Pyrus communis]|uniref:Metallothionein-like protein n=1 Tax=Pyrus ussuriensis x Pyrus communis TaxID=2448454 RepID=A0A5N5HSZ5_9ROSA|nr:metallothionein-like protein [Pyrus ussuriensis x Pyrus communis]